MVYHISIITHIPCVVYIFPRKYGRVKNVLYHIMKESPVHLR